MKTKRRTVLPRVRNTPWSIFEVCLSDYDTTFIYTDMNTVSDNGTSTDMAALEIDVAQPDKFRTTTRD